MIRMIKETHTPKCTTITISWSDCDKETMQKIKDIIRSQDACWNCVNYHDAGNFGDYHAHDCKIHGNIEAFDNPHHDCDGSKCSDYRRINE